MSNKESGNEGIASREAVTGQKTCHATVCWKYNAVFTLNFCIPCVSSLSHFLPPYIFNVPKHPPIFAILVGGGAELFLFY